LKATTKKERVRIVRLNIKERKAGSRRKFWKNNVVLISCKVSSPQALCLTNRKNFNTTARFINQISECARIRKKVHLDLSCLEYLVPCGTIYFMSTLEQIIEKYDVVITGTYPKNEITEQMLQKLGIISLMGLSERCGIDSDHVKDWQVHKGSDVSFNEDYDEVENFLNQNLGDDEFLKINSGISEAVSNACSHGYSLERSTKPWWGFVRKMCHNGTDVLVVVVSDLGVGIHETIPLSIQKKLGITIKEFASNLSMPRPNRHSSKIKAACELGMTQTGLKHRGKGLPEIKSVTESSEGSWLSVISGRGLVTFRNKKQGREVVSKLTDFNEVVKGTIICWQIPIA
jgi:hypothetical protein